MARMPDQTPPTPTIIAAHPTDQLVADLRDRAIVSRERVDRELMTRAAEALSALRADRAESPASPRARTMYPAGILAKDEAVAIAGLGPAFRLRMAAKTVVCPRCNQVVGLQCFNGRVCHERVWALAAARRRENAGEEEVNHQKRLLRVLSAANEAPTQETLRAATQAGVLRLERATDGSPRWVDA